jgi:hypothetical protein
VVRDCDRIGNGMEDIMDGAKSTDAVRSIIEALASVYVTDSLFSLQKVVDAMFDNVVSSSPDEEDKKCLMEVLFSDTWETELTSNQVARSIMETVADYWQDLSAALSDNQCVAGEGSPLKRPSNPPPLSLQVHAGQGRAHDVPQHRAPVPDQIRAAQHAGGRRRRPLD